MHALIVDDNATNGLLLQRVLGRFEDCTAKSFTSPVAALEHAAGSAYDVALVDYLMPEMSGVEFIERLHRLPGCERVPVILVTSAVERSLLVSAFAAGAADFITKPIDPALVRNRIRDVVSASKAAPA